MKTAIMIDQPGSFVVLSAGSSCSCAKGETNAGLILKKVLFFPPFLLCFGLYNECIKF
jgi:hypothetical protein